MGGQEFCDRYQAQLEKELEEMWESFSKHNEVRRQTASVHPDQLFASVEIYLKKQSFHLLQTYADFLNRVVINTFVFPLKVQKSIQCLPDPCGAVCLGVPSVRAVQCVVLRRPGHLRLDMWLCYGPDYDGCADVGLHPLLWTVSQRRGSHRPGRRRRIGTGAFPPLASGTGQVLVLICDGLLLACRELPFLPCKGKYPITNSLRSSQSWLFFQNMDGVSGTKRMFRLEALPNLPKFTKFTKT